MIDFFNWSIDLGRWAGVRVRVHYWLVIWAIFALVGAAIGPTPRVAPTLAWLAMFTVVLALHEVGHVVAARLRGADVEDVQLWPLGNLVGPSHARSHEDPVAAAGGLIMSGGLALLVAIGLAVAGSRMMLLPFGGPDDSGAPYVYAIKAYASPLTPRWYFGWFGWLNLVIFTANLIPALPLDMGRIVRATVARSSLGYSRDAMIAPWLAHTSTALLVIIGLLRLLFAGRLDNAITLILLAFFIEVIVRTESRMMEEGGFYDEASFGYDFSEGYTSLEPGTAKVRPRRESALHRWRRRRSDRRRLRRQSQAAAEERRLDEILDKLHRDGRSSLTDEEQRFLVRVSAKIRKKPRDRG